MDRLTRVFQGKVMGLDGPEMGAGQMEQEEMVQQAYNVGETAEQEANRKIGLSFGTAKNGYELTGLGGGGPTKDIGSLVGLGSGRVKKNMNDFIGLGSGSTRKKNIDVSKMLGGGKMKGNFNASNMLGGGKMKGNFDVSGFFNMGKSKNNINATQMLGGTNKKVSNMMSKPKINTFNVNKFFTQPARQNNVINNMIGTTKQFGFWQNAKQHMIKNPAQTGLRRAKQQRALSMFGDRDKDGVANILDCQPFNYFRQGPENNMEDEEFIGDEKIEAMENLEEELKRQEEATEEEDEIKDIERKQKLVEKQQELLTGESKLMEAELGVEKTAMDVQAQRAQYGMDLAQARSERDIEWRKQMAEAKSAERALAQQQLASGIVEEQASKPAWMQITGVPTMQELKYRAVLKQQMRDTAKRAAYPKIYAKEQELKLAEKYPQAYGAVYGKEKGGKSEYVRVKGKDGKIKYVKKKTTAGIPSGRIATATGAMSTAASAFGGGGAMGGADIMAYKMASMTGGSGAGFGAMVEDVGTGYGFGAMVGQRPIGMGMAQMVGGPPTGMGFAQMAGVPVQQPMQPQPSPQPMQPQMQQLAQQSMQESDKVGPPPSPEGKVWSPYSKKYVTYTRGRYDKTEEQMQPQPQPQMAPVQQPQY